MKNFFALCVVFITLIASLNLLSINVMAYDPAIPFSIFGYDNDGNLVQWEYIEIWKTEKAEKDFTLLNNQNIRVTSLNTTNSKLVIKNGATVIVKGEIFIERGGQFDIENGTVVIDGGNITNCGIINIGKKGTLKVLNGTFNSTAAGVIQNDGKITCLTSGKKLNNCFKSIKKYDNNFNLSDYTLLIDSNGSNAKITSNYCIDDIMTNYKYKFSIDTSSKKIKIVHTNYSLETVYKSTIPQNLKKRVSLFEDEHNKDLNFKMWYWKDYGYTYNYRSKELVYNAKWFSYDDMNDKFIENSFTGKA